MEYRVQIGVTTNMTQALECILITATDVTDAENPAEAGWLKEIRLEKDAEENIVLVFGIDRNDSSSDRKAAIRLEIPDADGKILAQAEASVVQTTDNATVVFKDEETTVSVPGDQHNRSALLTANFDVDPAHFSFDIAYDPAGTQWITDVTFSESAVSFVVAENTGDQPRSASLKITYKDTDVECSSTLRLTQEVKQLSIADLRAMIPGAEGEVELTGEKMLSAVVISDAGNYNMETNPNLTDTSIDFSVNEKTAYIESLDGQYGLRIVTKLPADNILKRYSSVQLSINGLKLVKESNPERYTLTGFTKEHVLNQNAGTAADLPKKEKHISELTDADIYTQVTLKRCQMAVRTGRFIPVHINYTNSFNNYYPAAVLDRHGDMIYLMTNHGCDWRFKEMPDGEGTITGIIVHEPYTFFERGGDIGRYQIRNVTREDIALDESADNVFSAVAVEWSPDGSKDPRAYAFPQYPHPATDSGQAHCVAATTGSGLSFMSTYAWLAVGSAYRAAENGLTINNASWGHKQLWDTAKNTGNSLIFEFSTQGVSSTQCSFVFTCRYHSAQGGLRYWTAEYSLDGDNWKKLTDFTVPDNGNWGNMQLEQLSGDKNVWMQVPTEILGQSVAWIRLRPVQNKIGTATTYDTATIASNGQVANAFTVSYAALRYNK